MHPDNVLIAFNAMFIRTEFSVRNASAHIAARKQNWLDEFFPKGKKL